MNKCLLATFTVPAFLLIYTIIMMSFYDMSISKAFIPVLDGYRLINNDTSQNPLLNSFHNHFISPVPTDFANKILWQPLGLIQQSYEEYSFVAITILSQQPSNVLIFGCGHDSYIYIYSNRYGYTLILEDELAWVKIAKKAMIQSMNMNENRINDFNFDIRPINYTTVARKVKLEFRVNKTINVTKLREVEYDKSEVNNINWRVILVDAPNGFNKGRMQSIFVAYNLVKESLQFQLKQFNEFMTKPENNNTKLSKDDILVHVFAHDTNRIEGSFAKAWFGENFLYLDRHYENELTRGSHPNTMMYFKCDLNWLNNQTIHKNKDAYVDIYHL
eukprot:275235_1